MNLSLKRVIAGMAFIIGAIAFVAAMVLFKPFGLAVVAVVLIAAIVGLAHSIGSEFIPNPDEDDRHGV